jgi:hypothetical protein
MELLMPLKKRRCVCLVCLYLCLCVCARARALYMLSKRRRCVGVWVGGRGRGCIVRAAVGECERENVCVCVFPASSLSSFPPLCPSLSLSVSVYVPLSLSLSVTHQGFPMLSVPPSSLWKRYMNIWSISALVYLTHTHTHTHTHTTNQFWKAYKYYERNSFCLKFYF